jgi:D-alanine-D-alanine ligase
MTGSASGTLALARRKDRVNRLLEARGLPIPAWRLWDGSSGDRFVADWGAFPAIVKPAAEDGSVGITQGSVVSGRDALARRLAEAASLEPLVVQAFVGDREVNAAIVGGTVLPLSEIHFGALPPGHFPMVDYHAKWSAGSPEDLGTRPVCPAPLPPWLAARIRLLALQAWRVIGGSGYGRVDFRLASPDTLYILEVNPNPDLSPSAGLAYSARVQGWDYPALVARILWAVGEKPEVAV